MIHLKFLYVLSNDSLEERKTFFISKMVQLFETLNCLNLVLLDFNMIINYEIKLED